MEKTKIAFLYDFDKTLITKDMQEFRFIPKLGIEAGKFWDDSNALSHSENMDMVLSYMYTMVQKSKEKKHPITREEFTKMGEEIEYFPGVLEWFDNINKFAEENNAEIEHYIISSGLKEIIEGTEIADKFKMIYACEFHYNENGEADWPKVAVNYTAKVQFLFRINKQVLDISNDRDVNSHMGEENKPIPFSRMIYFGDGLTDVPCMKLVKLNGGISFGVFNNNDSICKELFKDGRINYYFKADYSKNSQLFSTTQDVIRKMIIDHKLEKLYKEQKKNIKPE